MDSNMEKMAADLREKAARIAQLEEKMRRLEEAVAAAEANIGRWVRYAHQLEREIEEMEGSLARR